MTHINLQKKKISNPSKLVMSQFLLREIQNVQVSNTLTIHKEIGNEFNKSTREPNSSKKERLSSLIHGMYGWCGTYK